MSAGLKIDVVKKDGIVEAVFEGQIDEDSNFSSLEGITADVMVFDLEKVNLINSCGIRDWIEFQKALSPNMKLIYRKCPQVIVEQLNIVKGFIRQNSEVESFYAPYFNEAKDEEIKVLLTPSQIKDGMAPLLKDADGNELEFDEIEAQYFSFLKNG